MSCSGDHNREVHHRSQLFATMELFGELLDEVHYFPDDNSPLVCSFRTYQRVHPSRRPGLHGPYPVPGGSGCS